MAEEGDRLRQAARIFQEEADDASRLNLGVAAAFGPEVISGGKLGDSVADFVSSSGLESLAIAAELNALAARALLTAVIADAPIEPFDIIDDPILTQPV